MSSFNKSFSVLSVIAFFAFASSVAQADRTVSIAASGGTLELVNPSAGTVSYTVECYDKVSGTNITPSYTNVTLATKKTVKIESGGACAAGSTQTKKLSQGPLFCTSNVTYASASTLCGSDSQICTIPQLATLGVTASDFIYGYWIKPHATTTDWSSYSGKWYDYSTASGKKTYAPVTQSKSGSQCASGTAGSGSTVGYCSGGYTSSTYSGTVCCPANNGFASCKVTIHGTPASAGQLQSPQFKGGSSF